MHHTIQIHPNPVDLLPPKERCRPQNDETQPKHAAKDSILGAWLKPPARKCVADGQDAYCVGMRTVHNDEPTHHLVLSQLVPASWGWHQLLSSWYIHARNCCCCMHLCWSSEGQEVPYCNCLIWMTNGQCSWALSCFVTFDTCTSQWGCY